MLNIIYVLSLTIYALLVDPQVQYSERTQPYDWNGCASFRYWIQIGEIAIHDKPAPCEEP